MTDKIAEKFFELQQLLSLEKYREAEEKLSKEPMLAKSRDEFGDNLLIRIIDQAPLRIVEKLLENGTDVNNRSEDGLTCLHCLIEETDESPAGLKIMELILRQGFDTEIPGRMGYTILHRAAEYGRMEYGRLLMEYGADVNSKGTTEMEETPIMVAACHGHFDFYNFLIEEGADPAIKDIYHEDAVLKAKYARNRYKKYGYC
ncbi:MAG: ankyrin repeat domain-containing protein [Gammaproteobacteria bacterium]|nr:ankyrin repeat domain-containing protein [Gammaproteobacteria bacterium]